MLLFIINTFLDLLTHFTNFFPHTVPFSSKVNLCHLLNTSLSSFLKERACGQ